MKGAVEGALAAFKTTLRQPVEATQHINIKKPDRPTIDMKSNESQWQFFIHEWKDYKSRANLLGIKDIRSELKAACSVSLRQKLFDFVGGDTLDTLEEDALLQNIRMLSIEGKNKAVHRKEFYSMNQDVGQPVQTFVATLRSKAQHCNFTFRCTSELWSSPTQHLCRIYGGRSDGGGMCRF